MPRGPGNNPGPVIVYNLVGTSRRKCKCGFGTKTWLRHWSTKTQLRVPQKCSAKFCKNITQVGAHVRLEGADGRVAWIIPFCMRHNKRPSSQPIVVKHGVTLCRATMAECDRA